MQGYIKLHRQIFEWEWYTDGNVKSVFIHCLLKANYTDKKWRGIMIKRGSFITSRNTLSKELKLSEQQIRTAINKLKSTNEITSVATNEYTLITVCNYDSYQLKEDINNQQDNQRLNNPITNEQPTNNQRITSTNNNKKYKNEKNEKEVQAGGKNTPPTSNDFVNELILMFSELYFRYRLIEYIPDGKDRKAVGMLLGKYRKQNKGKDTEECRLDFEAFFKECLNIDDNWLHKNMTLPIINSKYNVIRNILQVGNEPIKTIFIGE